MTFDWAQVAYIGSPLLTPWWAAANVVGGLIVVMWIIAPLICMIPFTHMASRLTRFRLQKCVVFCLYAYTFVRGL